MENAIDNLREIALNLWTALDSIIIFTILNSSNPGTWYIYLFCCCSVIQSCPALCDPMGYSMPGIPLPHHLLKFDQVYVLGISDAIQPSYPLSFPPPPAFNLSQNQGMLNQFFSSGGQSIGVSALEFSFSPSKEYSGLISFRMDWLDFLAVQGALKSLLQHHSSKASILQHSLSS